MDKNRKLLQQGISKLLRSLRSQTGWTQKYLGQRLTYSESYVSYLENRKVPITIEILLHICKLFNLTISDLMLYLEVYALEKRQTVIESITERLVEKLAN